MRNCLRWLGHCFLELSTARIAETLTLVSQVVEKRRGAFVIQMIMLEIVIRTGLALPKGATCCRRGVAPDLAVVAA